MVDSSRRQHRAPVGNGRLVRAMDYKRARDGSLLESL